VVVVAVLLKTRKYKNQHTHIVYLRDDGSGVTSVSEKHSHSINQGVVEPAQDGHIHEADEYPLKDEGGDPKLKDSEVLDNILTLYKEARDIEKESRDAAIEAEEMYSHKQWEDATAKDLATKDRAAITINQLEAKIDNLSGYQRQNRTEIRYIPMEGGDSRVADILNYVVKDILENCYYQREKTKVFEDVCVPGRGFFNHYEDRDKNILGDVVVERYEWDGAACGPHEKDDLSDCDYIVKWKWFSLSKIKEMHPEKASRIVPEDKESEVPANSRSEDWDKRHSESKSSGWSSYDMVDVAKKQYRVVQIEQKEYRRVNIIVNANDGFVFNSDGWSDADVNAVKTMPGFSLIPRVTFRMRMSKAAGGVVLEDYYPDLAVQDFSIVPVYAKKRGNKWWGKVEGVKDLQRLINKSYSQFVDILNKVVSYGWFYDENTFADKKEEQKFKNNASSPGFISKLQDLNRKPVKEEGVKFPAELVNAISLFSQNLREIINVNLEMMGAEGGNQSGIALRQKIVQQLLGNDFIFDNLSFAEKKLGKLLISYVQKLYDAKRIMRVLINQSYKNPNEAVTLGGIPIDQFTVDSIDYILKTTDLSAHDVNISESPASPSAMMSNFLALLELAGKGVQIPPSLFFKYAPIPDKDQALAEVNAMMQQQMTQENKKYETEIIKAKIAQEGRGMAYSSSPFDGGQ
jgi:hypothetical protein